MLPSQYLEKGWTQRNYAINKSGLPVSLHRDGACAWCLSGALNASHRDGTLTRYDIVKIYSIITEKIYEDPMLWNDDANRTQEEVVNIIKEIEQELGLVVTQNIQENNVT